MDNRKELRSGEDTVVFIDLGRLYGEYRELLEQTTSHRPRLPYEHVFNMATYFLKMQRGKMIAPHMSPRKLGS